jgi:NitT/TauT family transport system substrate-binding protein
MGCAVTTADFAQAHPTVINAFLDDYKASIEYVSNASNYDTSAEYIVEAGVLDAAGPAKKSLMNLGSSISYVDGDRMQAILDTFYNAIDYSVIGGNVPDESFYYKK